MHKTLDKRFAEVYNNAIFAGTVAEIANLFIGILQNRQYEQKKEKVYEKICYNHACSGNVSYYWRGGSRLRR